MSHWLIGLHSPQSTTKLTAVFIFIQKKGRYRPCPTVKLLVKKSICTLSFNSSAEDFNSAKLRIAPGSGMY